MLQLLGLVPGFTPLLLQVLQPMNAQRQREIKETALNSRVTRSHAVL
jgi:hypothetical protein